MRLVWPALFLLGFGAFAVATYRAGSGQCFLAPCAVNAVRPTAGATQATPPQTRPPALKVNTLSGEPLDVYGDFKGQLVLLDFWATWCPPCRAELPHVRRAYETLRSRGLAVVGVTLDAARGVSPAQVAEFARTQNLAWPQVYDGAFALAERFGVSGIPSAFLIRADTGEVLASGAALRGDALAGTLERHLPAP